MTVLKQETVLKDKLTTLDELDTEIFDLLVDDEIEAEIEFPTAVSPALHTSEDEGLTSYSTTSPIDLTVPVVVSATTRTTKVKFPRIILQQFDGQYFSVDYVLGVIQVCYMTTWNGRKLISSVTYTLCWNAPVSKLSWAIV